MDIVTRERRSEMMANIRATNTSPERRVRSALHKAGFRFRRNSGNVLIGKPDIVLRRISTVIFVHGCFWHHHAGCKYAYIPKTRRDFWTDKFRKNAMRDRKVARKLASDGWNVITIWECQTRDSRDLSRRVTTIRTRTTRRAALKKETRHKGAEH